MHHRRMRVQVDWEGQKRQFDAAAGAGVGHVVVISSMGGTQPENTLNKIGDGNILVWKRKAEQYLAASGLTYTILHPGGILFTHVAAQQAPQFCRVHFQQRDHASAVSLDAMLVPMPTLLYAVCRRTQCSAPCRRRRKRLSRAAVCAGLKDSPGGEAGVVLDVDDKLLERKVRSIARADVAELCVQSLRLDSAKNRSVDCINDESLPVPKSTADFGSLFSSLQGDCDYSLNPAP